MHEKVQSFHPTVYSPKEMVTLSRRVINVVADKFAADEKGKLIVSLVEKRSRQLSRRLETDNKNEFTPEIHALDEKRSNLFYFIRNTTETNIHHPSDRKKRNAARILLSFITAHLDNFSHTGYGEKSRKINFLINRFSVGDYKKYCLELGLTEWIEALAGIEGEFEQAVAKRADSVKKITRSDAAAKLEDALISLFGYINALAVTEGPGFVPLVLAVNETIDDVDAIARARRTREENGLENGDTPAEGEIQEAA